MSGLGPIDRSPIDPLIHTDVPLAEPVDAASTEGSASFEDTAALVRGASGAGSLSDLWAAIGTGAAAPDTDRNLDATGARRPVALGANHRFTAAPGTPADTPEAIGAGLYAAATLIDDSKGNLFDDIGLGAADAGAVFETLAEDLGTVPAGGPSPAGLSDLQSLQLRSSGTTVLLELMTASSTTPELKHEAFALYRGLVDAETNPTLKDGMVLHLHRLRDTLPAELHGEIDELKQVLGPDKPPYDAWFKDGNDTVQVHWVSQSHATEINKKQLTQNGFELVSDTYDKKIFKKTITENGVDTKFEVTIVPHRMNMYDEVESGDAHMVVYSGHSNWGRNMRESLDKLTSGEDGGANKLVFTELCVGKGEIQMFRDKFPKAHLVTTHNSSYFRPGSNAEGVQGFIQAAQGVAARRGYEEIAADVHAHNPWRTTHEYAGIDNNFIFPTDVATRRKVLDSDHDGQADVFDRLIDFNTFDVEEDTAREFEPIQGSRPADELVGTKVHFASQTINRLAIYSGIFEDANSTGDVVPAGYFEPGEGETSLFRFERQTVDGEELIAMSMNSRYAHMSEEALRMAACYEYNAHMAETEPEVDALKDLPENTVLSGMILASHSLYTDASSRDIPVWKEFLSAYNLPEVSRSDVENAKGVNSHFYSGSWQSIDKLRELLDPAILAALTAPGAGVPAPR